MCTCVHTDNFRAKLSSKGWDLECVRVESVQTVRRWEPFWERVGDFACCVMLPLMQWRICIQGCILSKPVEHQNNHRKFILDEKEGERGGLALNCAVLNSTF